MSGKDDINCNDNSAACHYLNAVSAARSLNYDDAIINLQKAIDKEVNYKKEAAIDLEFSNLRSDEAFINLIK